MHATAVSIAGRGLLIRGASGAGKSALALALIAATTRSVLLVGDDRVLLRRQAGGIAVRPHPRIAGFIERRGLGLLAVPWCGSATLAGCVGVGDAAVPAGEAGDWLGQLPLLALPTLPAGGAAAAARRVLAWFDAVAADGTQVA